MDNCIAKRLDEIRLIADELPVALIIHCVNTLKIIYMNRPGLERLGISMEELQSMGQEQYFLKFFSTEDSKDYVPKIIQVVNSDTNTEVSYFQQVRTISEWQLYVSNTKVFLRNEKKEPTHLITVAGMLDPEHHITANVRRLMEEIRFLKAHTSVFSKLTKREREILKYIAKGMNSGEIAENLFISPATANTHRRNIRNKLSLKNNYEAVQFAHAFNLL